MLVSPRVIRSFHPGGMIVPPGWNDDNIRAFRLLQTNEKMSIKYDLYKSPPKETEEGTVTRYHARVANSRTVGIDEWSKSIHRPRTDLKAAMAEISDRFLEELQNGNRVHLEGIGYFQMTLSCPTDVKSRNEVRAEAIHFKSVAFTPEERLRKQLKRTKFIRSDRSAHSLGGSEPELAEVLAEYFKSHNYITRRQLEALCYMTRSTAYRRLKTWVAEGRMKLVPEIDAYAPVPGNFGTDEANGAQP